MTVTVKNLVAPVNVPTSASAQYTATNLTAIIDKCTVVNYSTTAATVTIYLPTSAATIASNNLVMQTKTLQPAETYTCPEVVGHVLASGSAIVAVASAALSIAIRVSGREVT
jgi:hypothetical protein